MELSRREIISLHLLGVAVFLSRMPFLGRGYGVDPDAWRVVLSSRHIAEVGNYVWSRPPGYPVHELVSAWFAGSSPEVLNGLTALMCVTAVIALALILRRAGQGEYILLAASMAFVPIVYISSTVTMDYLWALALILAGFYAAFRRAALTAGILLGFAVGCRITSGAMLIPNLLLLYQIEKERFLQRAVVLTASTLITSGLLFLPVFMHYGSGFFTFYDIPAPPFDKVLRTLGVQVWGSIGLVALVVALLAGVFKRLKRTLPGAGSGNGGSVLVLPSLAAILFYLIAFARLPVEAAYLIPLVPFVLILIGTQISRMWVTVVALLLMVSPFTEVFGPWRFAGGPIIREHERRGRETRMVSDAADAIRRLEGKNAIVAAWWQPHLKVLLGYEGDENLSLMYNINEAQVANLLEHGFRIHYMAGLEYHIRSCCGVELADVGELLKTD